MNICYSSVFNKCVTGQCWHTALLKLAFIEVEKYWRHGCLVIIATYCEGRKFIS